MNVLIGGPDILEVPVPRRNNKCGGHGLLDEMGQRQFRYEIKLLLLFQLCCSLGIPEVLHSDQGRNFEIQLFCDMLTAFGIQKSHTTAYHPQGDGMVE